MENARIARHPDRPTKHDGTLKERARNAWIRKLESVQVYEKDVQSVILNYFTVMGHESAAEAFAKEAGCQPEMPVQCIGLRSKIRDAVLLGEIDQAVEYLEKISPIILTNNPALNFRLKQQKFLQLVERVPSNDHIKYFFKFFFEIVQKDLKAAITFSQEELAPLVNSNPSLLPELEKSMTLLFFPDLDIEAAQRCIHSIDQKEKAAEKVDNVILEYFNIEKESVLEMLARKLISIQRKIQLENELSYIPHFVDESDDLQPSPRSFRFPLLVDATRAAMIVQTSQATESEDRVCGSEAGSLIERVDDTVGPRDGRELRAPGNENVSTNQASSRAKENACQISDQVMEETDTVQATVNSLEDENNIHPPEEGLLWSFGEEPGVFDGFIELLHLLRKDP